MSTEMKDELEALRKRRAQEQENENDDRLNSVLIRLIHAKSEEETNSAIDEIDDGDEGELLGMAILVMQEMHGRLILARRALGLLMSATDGEETLQDVEALLKETDVLDGERRMEWYE